jgi:hypothetical protein
MTNIPAFDPYQYDYKSYFKEYYNLNEMPEKLPSTDFSMNDYEKNAYAAMRIEQNAKLLKNWEEYRLFYEFEDDTHFYSLLSKDSSYICMEHSFVRITSPIKGIENTHIWNSKYNKGLISYWFNKEIIPNESIIISDKIQSDAGYKFWQGLFSEYVTANSHKMYIIDMKTGNIVKNITSVNDMDEFRGNGQFQMRYVLSKL